MKKFFALFVFLFSFLIVQQDVDALEIMRKEGNVFGTTTIESNRVQTLLPGGQTKFVRHIKYLDSTQKNQESYTQTSGNFTRFSYRCPGYYMTRTYSDYKGSKQTGTIRIYVAPGDIPNAPSHCAEVTPPPNNVATAPADVVKINTTHPNALAVEAGNMINADYDFPSGSEVWGQIADPGTEGYVDPSDLEPVDPVEPQYPFEFGSYNPIDDFDSMYDKPNVVMPNDPGWVNNVSFANGNTPQLSVFFNVGRYDWGEAEQPPILDQNLAKDACIAAGGTMQSIYLYDYAISDYDQTICISKQEYNDCDLVRYFAIYRDGWVEADDERFTSVSQDLQDLLSFPVEYCKVHTQYIEPSYPYDPVTEVSLSRAAYQVVECTDDSDACHDMLPDPYYTPITAPVNPGGDGGNTTNPDGGGGGSPRRGAA